MLAEWACMLRKQGKFKAQTLVHASDIVGLGGFLGCAIGPKQYLGVWASVELKLVERVTLPCFYAASAVR